MRIGQEMGSFCLLPPPDTIMVPLAEEHMPEKEPQNYIPTLPASENPVSK